MIDYCAFESAKFKGEFKTPNRIKRIERFSFKQSEFSGELKLNNDLEYIGEYALRLSKFTGEFNYSKVKYIGGKALYNSLFTGDLNLPLLEKLGGNELPQLNDSLYGDALGKSSFTNVTINEKAQLFGKNNIRKSDGSYQY